MWWEIWKVLQNFLETKQVPSNAVVTSRAKLKTPAHLSDHVYIRCLHLAKTLLGPFIRPFCSFDWLIYCDWITHKFESKEQGYPKVSCFGTAAVVPYQCAYFKVCMDTTSSRLQQLLAVGSLSPPHLGTHTRRRKRKQRNQQSSVTMDSSTNSVNPSRPGKRGTFADIWNEN